MLFANSSSARPELSAALLNVLALLPLLMAPSDAPNRLRLERLRLCRLAPRACELSRLDPVMADGNVMGPLLGEFVPADAGGDDALLLPIPLALLLLLLLPAGALTVGATEAEAVEAVECVPVAAATVPVRCAFARAPDGRLSEPGVDDRGEEVADNAAVAAGTLADVAIAGGEAEGSTGEASTGEEDAASCGDILPTMGRI